MLYIFAIGVVRGFAFALGISTLIDIAVFFWFTKPVMTLLARVQFFNSGQAASPGCPGRHSASTKPRAHAELAGGRA